MYDSLIPHGLQPTRLLYPWDFPGKNTCRGYHFLFQGIFLTQGSNPCLLHCRRILYPLEPLGKPLCCIRAFSNRWALSIRWSKYWSFSFSISPSNGYSRLIPFRIDWFDLLAVQGTLKSLLQHHSLKASVLHIRWPKNWSFSFSISPSSEYSGLIPFKVD